MPSRLLTQLDDAIDAAKDPLLRDRLRAERAGVLARHGNIGQSRRIVNELRSRGIVVDDSELSVWLLLAEGMADHFESISPRARRRFLSAHALAASAGESQLQALAAAWLATAEWNQSQWDDAVAHVAEALRMAAPDSHSAHARACLLVADAYHHAGEVTRAQSWFERSREHANADGDTSMVSALLYNRASCRVSAVGLADAFGLAEPNEGLRALLEAESTIHFDAGLGTASLKAMVPMLRAQALVVNGRHADALAVFGTYGDAAREQGFGPHMGRVLSDQAWCRCKLGEADKAIDLARQALARLEADSAQPDDRAATLARAASVAAVLGLQQEAAQWQADADTALAAFRAQQKRLVRLLDGALVPVAPQ